MLSSVFQVQYENNLFNKAGSFLNNLAGRARSASPGLGLVKIWYLSLCQRCSAATKTQSLDAGTCCRLTLSDPMLDSKDSRPMPFHENEGDCHQNTSSVYQNTSIGSVSNGVAALSVTKSHGAIASMLVPRGKGKSNNEGAEIYTFCY